MDAHEADRLATRARTGDGGALAALYGEFAPALMAYVERLCGDRASAEDVIHETFLQLLESRGRFEAKGRFRQWLFTVAANAARGQKRRGRVLVRWDGDDVVASAVDATPSRTTAPDDNVANREYLVLIERTLAQLPPGYASAFHLRVREGFNYREMSEISGEPEGTLRSRVHLTLSRLREDLAAAGKQPKSKTEGRLS